MLISWTCCSPSNNSDCESGKFKTDPTNLFHEMHLRWYAFGVDYFLEHVDHVVELSVDVTNDDHGLLDSDHV